MVLMVWAKVTGWEHIRVNMKNEEEAIKIAENRYKDYFIGPYIGNDDSEWKVEFGICNSSYVRSSRKIKPKDKN